LRRRLRPTLALVLVWHRPFRALQRLAPTIRRRAADVLLAERRSTARRRPAKGYAAARLHDLRQ
jgi:hypothetical protein